VTYYLHADDPEVPTWHDDYAPPLFLTERFPGHGILYNYNSSDPTKPGREVQKGGTTPPSETEQDKYIEWRTYPQQEPLTLEGNVVVTLWGKNPANQTLVARAYLYEKNNTGYNLIAMDSYSWAAAVTTWQEMTFTFGISEWQIDVGSELVVWVISDSAKSLHFAYDTTVYPSMIEFSGRWDSGQN
jgi:hypothetical protein